MKTTMATLPVGTRCKITVPGSTSNLGPGFDSIGCAVGVNNRFEFVVMPDGAEPTVELGGRRPQGISQNADNLALVVASNFFRAMGATAPTLSLRAEIDVPSARGLGSSSTAIVAGLAAANALMDNVLSAAELLDVAVELEGHADNVAPAMLGGMVVSATHTRPLAYRRIAVHSNVAFVFVVPDYEVKTADARAVLPKTIPYGDAIFNASRSPLVLLSMMTGDMTGLAAAIDDKLHQPYRKHLFRHYDELQQAAQEGGAAGFCVSGAGPTMLAIATQETKSGVIAALRDVMRRVDLHGMVEEIAPDDQGMKVEIGG